MSPASRTPDFYDDEPRSFAFPGLTPVVKWLLIANIGLGVLFLLTLRSEFAGQVHDLLALDSERWRARAPLVPLWELVTFGFLHSRVDPTHVLFNMLGLFFFGTAMEARLGSRRFAWFYLAAIVVPAVLQLTASLLFHWPVLVVGASGAVLALVVALATLEPRARVIFILVPLKLWVLATIYVALDVIGLVAQTGNAAHLVHLGGAALGFTLVKTGWLWFDPAAAYRQRREQRVEEQAQSDEQRLDQLLERIHREGIGSLSARDKDFLKRMSSRKSG
ncbi:MAG: rhomboid family intramembrane serine protease [Planctomycetes bacterium]|nr:rhomboid family intramembrane serine protease [Planctomycetota bacterium]